MPETKPEDDRINWTWHAEGAAPHPGGPAVIFDIDGVLSDAAGRQHFLERGGGTGRPSSRPAATTP